MRIGKVRCLVTVLFLLAAGAVGDAYGDDAPSTPEAALQEHGIPLHAVPVAHARRLPITNSMLVSWGVGLSLIVLTRLATRKMTPVPGRLLNLIEMIVEGLLDVLSGIMGKKLAVKTFWIMGTLFIFIVSANCAGLLPGVGSIGWGGLTDHGFVVTRPLFRGANADLNMTLAMAIVFSVCWAAWAVQEHGVIGVVVHLFGPKGEARGLMAPVMILMFMAVGVLEVISILFRPVSLSFRLFGNTYAGETLLETLLHALPALSWILPVPVYLMEILVAVVQATVFMLLAAVFTMLICEHDSAESGHHLRENPGRVVP